jgi:hypothetical protein
LRIVVLAIPLLEAFAFLSFLAQVVLAEQAMPIFPDPN